MALTEVKVVYAAASVIVGCASLAMAAVIVAPKPLRRVNVALAAFLAAVGVNAITYWMPSMSMPERVAWSAELIRELSGYVTPPIYALFFTAALDSPLVRPFKARGARAALWALAGVIGIRVVVGYAGIVPMATVDTVAYDAMWLGAVAYSTIAIVSAWRLTAPDSLARRRALAYLKAFILIDVAQAIFILALLPAVRDGARGASDFAVNVVGGIAFMAGLALLASALLRERLFDFDLKVKIGVKRGTIAAVFLAVFFVVSQLIQNVANAQLGYVAGAVGSGLLLFALAPLQRAAERLSTAALPGVVDSPEYRLVKKREVYRSAVETAMGDGFVTEKERTLLARLADQLGLTVSETLDIERDARGL